MLFNHVPLGRSQSKFEIQKYKRILSLSTCVGGGGSMPFYLEKGILPPFFLFYFRHGHLLNLAFPKSSRKGMSKTVTMATFRTRLVQ